MLKPYFWKQTDPKWRNKSYRGMTLGAGGCGPTDCANVISSLTGKNFTPAKAWDWMKKHGYLYPGQGTAWAGITACLKAHGIDKFTVTYDPTQAKKSLRKGWWVMTVVGYSRWTTSGHYITIYDIRTNNKLSISDPYSSSDYCQKDGTYSEFARAMKCAWVCINPADYADIRKKNKAKRTTKFVLYVKNAKCNIRKGRGMKYGVKAKAKRGTKFTLYSYKNHWYRIYSGKYKGCFIHENQLTNFEPYNATWKVNTCMNVRDGHTTKGTKILRSVARGTKIKSTRKAGDWVYCPSVKGWIRYRSADRKINYMSKI